MRAAMLVALLGCGGSPTPAPARPAPAAPAADPRAACAAAIGKAATTGLEGGEPDERSIKAQAVMTDTCVTTRWPQEVLLCLTNGASKDELRACPDMLTPAQQQALIDALSGAGLVEPAP